MPTHRFPLDGPINLQVRIGHGSLTVDTHDDLTEATVRIEPGKHGADILAQTVVALTGNTLVVNTPRQGGIFDLPVFGGRRSSYGLNIHIVVPTGTAVKLSSVTAPIVVTGRVSGADVAFGSGEAALRDVEGDLRLRFGSGSARVVRVTGSVSVRSGRGDVQFGEIGGTLSAGSGGGDLRVRVARGTVRSRCGSGTAHFGEVHGDVDVTSGSGTLEIGLPSGVSARVDVHTASGQVHSELPIEDEPRSPDGAISVRARTGSGDVRLFRAA